MRVGFDISRLYLNQTGIGSCIKNLQAAFEQLPHPAVEFIYLKPSFLGKPNSKSSSGKLGKVAEHLALNYWYQVGLPLRLRQLKCDVLLSPDPASPVFAPCPSVVTLYDMLVDIYPQYYGLVWRWFYHLFDQNALRRADRVICISRATQRDLLQMLAVPAERTRVIPIAADPVFRPLAFEEVNKVLSRYNLLAQNYLLFVGGTNPRKNLRGMLAAFNLLSSRWPLLQLVVVGLNAGNKSGSRVSTNQTGDAGWQNAFDIATDLQTRIVAPGYVSQSDLIALYTGATALVYPSLYEGFGLPPLEAMACGCPVIISNTGAMPEVVGAATLPFNPLNPSEIVTQLEILLSQPHERARLIAAGFEQTKKFDWLETARRTLLVLNEVV